MSSSSLISIGSVPTAIPTENISSIKKIKTKQQKRKQRLKKSKKPSTQLKPKLPQSNPNLTSKRPKTKSVSLSLQHIPIPTTTNFSLSDAKVLIRTLPNRVMRILSLGYKLLLPSILGSGLEETKNILSSEAETCSRLGKDIPQLIKQLRVYKTPPVSPNVSRVLVQEGKSILDMLKQSLAARREVIVGFHSSMVQQAVKTHLLAKSMVQHQTKKLIEYNDLVDKTCQQVLIQKDDDNVKPVVVQQRLIKMEDLITSILRKLNIPKQGYLARSSIPPHIRIQRLLSVSDLPSLGKGCTLILERLPRPKIANLLKVIREKEVLRKTLLLGRTNIPERAAQLRELDLDIGKLREEVTREIVKNTHISRKAFKELDKSIGMNLTTPPSESMKPSVLKLLQDIGKVSVLCQLEEQEKQTQQHRQRIECDTRSDIIKRNGMESFSLWYTETLQNTITSYTLEWMKELDSVFSRSIHSLGVSISHLLNEIKRPRFHVIHQYIEGEILSMYKETESELLTEHRKILAQILNFSNQCLQN